MQLESNGLRKRVFTAAEAALRDKGSVGPLELFMYMRFLQLFHFEQWQKGHEQYRVLEPHLQVGPAKFQQTLQYFAEWVRERGLAPIEAPYTRRTLSGVQPLQVTAEGNPEREKLFRIRYAPAGLSERKAKQLTQKLSKAPDLVVFQKVSEEGNCAECGTELSPGSLLFMESGQPLCLECADLDHLVFLPAGDTALSRRARKHSPLSAVVVRFNRPRKRYERQGLLVTPAALAQAEDECAADAPERAARRAEAAVQRQAQDREFIQEMTEALLKQFPKCPPAEARAVAEHTAERGSGRVGRSAAGRALDPQALELALRAHIRHGHTNYDTLLMQGVARQEARAQIREQVERLAASWSAA
jgi:hypothetical protein